MKRSTDPVWFCLADETIGKRCQPVEGTTWHDHCDWYVPAVTGSPKFCTACDGYGVTLPVGSCFAVECPVCQGKTADRSEYGPGARGPKRLNENPTLPERLRSHQVQMVPPSAATMRLLGEAADEIERLTPAVDPDGPLEVVGTVRWTQSAPEAN